MSDTGNLLPPPPAPAGGDFGPQTGNLLLPAVTPPSATPGIAPGPSAGAQSGVVTQIGNSAGAGLSVLATVAPAIGTNPPGFDPDLSITDLIVNGAKVSEDIISAVSSIALQRTTTGASTLTITLEDPYRQLVNSPICYISAPATPIELVAGQPAEIAPGITPAQSAADAATAIAGGAGADLGNLLAGPRSLPGPTSALPAISPADAQTGNIAGPPLPPKGGAALTGNLLVPLDPTQQAATPPPPEQIAANAAADQAAAEAALISNASDVDVAYQPTTVAVTDGTSSLLFALVQTSKQGDTVTLTFEDVLINQLRYAFPTGQGQSGLVANVTGSGQTRADFMAMVVNIAMNELNSHHGAVTSPRLAYPTPSEIANATEALTWGGSSNTSGGATGSTNGAGVTEDAWSCLVRLANEVQWRCFSDGTTLFFGPDEWLLNQPLVASFSERAIGGNVDQIDFDWDVGKAQATLTITATTALMTFHPGRPLATGGLGVASGVWLVSDVSRPDLTQPDVTISCLQAQPSISESMAASNASGGSASAPVGTNAAGQSTVAPAANVGAGGSGAAQKAVAAALGQQGVAYVFGGATPSGFDCSGLMQWAYAQAGITIPRTSQTQYAGLPTVPPALPNLLPGDLIFTNFGDQGPGPDHVGMYLGNNQVVQAPTTGDVVRIVGFDYFTSGQQWAVARPVA